MKLSLGDILVLILLAAMVGGAILFMVSALKDIIGWMKCEKCKVRLASIKIDRLHTPTTYRLERLGDGTEYLDSHVCSVCWDRDLVRYDYPSTVIGTWFVGATVEYLKNTPALFAVVISLASLGLSILSLTQ